MSSVSDHRVLFLLLGGVGTAALLQGFWDAPGDLPSPRKEACRWEEALNIRQVATGVQVVWCNEEFCCLGAYLDGLAEAPDGPILHRRYEVG